MHSVAAPVADLAESTVAAKNDPEIPRLIGVARAAEILGVGRQWVWQLIEDGELPAVKPARDYLLREQVVLEYKARMELERQNRD